MKSESVNIRLPEDDLQLARTLAARKGLPYQTTANHCCMKLCNARRQKSGRDKRRCSAVAQLAGRKPLPEQCVKLVHVIFEWDARKGAANLKRHKVTFEDAATVFLDPLAMTFSDPDHSIDERREITIGHTMEGHLMFVAHCERGNNVRIISARRATATERKQYEEQVGRG